jgi:hypothetical protein
MKCCINTTLVLALFSGTLAHAQPKKFRVTPLPVVYYSPETKLGFGALVAGNFSLATDSLTTTSYAQSYILYTLNKQYDWGNMVRLYSPQNKFIFQGRFSYTYFPEFYYGIETENPKPNEATIEYTRLNTDFRFYVRVKKTFYAGLVSRYNRIDNVASDPTGSFYAEKPYGYAGYQILGIAPLLAIESRDNQNYPRTGAFVELQLLGYPRWNDTFSNFFNLRLDARKYFPLQWLSTRDVLAIQLFATVNEGNVPFRDMADIGGSNVMRGYYTGFYRYKNLYAFQAEYRAGLWRFIGLDVWAGAALTPLRWYTLGDTSVKPNAGIGLRIMINQKDKLNVRVDQGFGKKQQQGFYLDIAEAF